MIDRSDELIADLQPETAIRAWWLIYSARRAGIPMFILSGRRSYTTNRDAGGASKSYHLSGRAFDVAVLGHQRDEIAPEWWQEVGEFAEVHLGLTWGGRFRSPDVNHFDSRGVVS